MSEENPQSEEKVIKENESAAGEAVGKESVNEEAETDQVKAEEKPAEEKPTAESQVKADAAETRKHWWQRKPKKQTGETKDPKKATETLPTEPTDSLEANLKALALHIEVKERNDYWQFKFRKKTLLAIGGVLILMLWMFWAAQQLTKGESGSRLSLKGMFLKVEKTEPTPAPTPMPEIMIRIRYPMTELASGAAELADKLRLEGYGGVEAILDENGDYRGVYVISKPNEIALRDKLEGYLALNYAMASPAAELTTDSDFDAVILYAPIASGAAVEM